MLRIKGHSKLNSNGTGVGIVLCDDADDSDDTIVWTARKYLPGDRNPNLAEFTALILGLQYALQLGARRIVVETDHDVFAKQLLGIYPVVTAKIKPLYWQVMDLKELELQSFEVRLVHRNEEACDLAKKALATGKSVNMSNESVTDPMGKDFTGAGKQSGIGPVNGNDTEMSTIDPSRTYLLQFDGGARGNPAGKSGCGMVLYDDEGKEVWCGWKFLEPMSNNRAEYYALLLGLLCARSLGVTKLRVQGDSQLVVRQMLGKYKANVHILKLLREQARSVAAEFEEFDIGFIYRAQNKRADWLSNHAMDTETSHGFEEA